MSLPIVGQPGPKNTLTPDEVAAKIRAALPDAEVVITDLTGTNDHYQAEITSKAFEGLGLVDQHQLIYKALAEELKGPIHALTLKTRTP